MTKKHNHGKHIHEEELTFSNKINNFLYNNRKVMLIGFAILAILFLVVVVGSYFISIKKTNSIAKIETAILEFDKFKTKELKNSITELTPEEKSLLEKQEESFIKEISQFANKNSYVGFMANTEIAEIYYSRKDWDNALKTYEKAGACVSSSYAMGPALFNAGACADELGNKEKAVELYLKASKIEDFPFQARAIFNAARIQEKIDVKESIESYNKITVDYPNTEWAKLSKTRVIQLSLEK